VILSTNATIREKKKLNIAGEKSPLLGGQANNRHHVTSYAGDVANCTVINPFSCNYNSEYQLVGV
jgi:hypothetical protein